MEAENTEPKPNGFVLNKANLAIASLVEKVAEGRYSLRQLHCTNKATEVTTGIVAVRVSLPKVEQETLPDETTGQDFDALVMPIRL